MSGTIALAATPQEFKFGLLRRFYEDLGNVEVGNYAASRFSFDGIDRSMLFDVEKHAVYLDWFTRHFESVFHALHLLADQKSRDLYIEILRYRLAGHLHVRIHSDAAGLNEQFKEFRRAFRGTPSAMTITGMFGQLTHYDADWEGLHYDVDTITDELFCSLVAKQYYFARDGIIIQPAPGDHVIDGGAFTGASAIVFSNSVGPEGHVYSFDPVGEHIEICKHNFARLPVHNVTLIECGLSDQSVDAPAVTAGGYSPGWRVDDSLVPLCRIDDLVASGNISRIDFIKMDIEGSEMNALRGAVDAIKTFQPKLAISIYHKPDDFFDIVGLLQSLNLGYRFYLDHYTIWDEETVLYAVTDR